MTTRHTLHLCVLKNKSMSLKENDVYFEAQKEAAEEMNDIYKDGSFQSEEELKKIREEEKNKYYKL